MEKHSYVTRPNLEYIETLYQAFMDDPESVGPEWRLFFEGVEFAQNFPASPGAGGQLQGAVSSQELDVYNLINAYRSFGHFEANLNPLSDATKSFPELSFTNFNLKDEDLDKTFSIGAIVGKPNAKLKDLIQHLRDSYCRTISVQVSEAMPTVRDWFYNEFERRNGDFHLSGEEKKEIFKQLARTEAFEKFLHTRYVGKKRFSIEGGDGLIPMLEALVARGSRLALEEIVIGMAHRGRLNVLTNFMGKELEALFAEFEGVRDEHNSFFDGDVKYHLGYSADKKTPGGGTCHVSLAFNPSHLETVDPVVCGMTRAKQRRRRDTTERKKVVPVLIHGDAAFAGQGIVAETFQMSQLQGYTVGGTIHIVVDNQVGFTTNPQNARSTPYASDISKVTQTPVLHVNGDDAESCVRAMDIAIRFRQEFKRDIVINMLCYRRFGHNEGDEPAFTQPLMYDKIKKHPTLMEQYAKKLIADGVMATAEVEGFYKGEIERLQKVLDQTRKQPPPMKPLAFEGFWKGLRRATPEDFKKTWPTATSKANLQKVGELLTTWPKSFSIHPKVQKLLETRKTMLDGEGAVDWGLGELLAYGTLLSEGTSVRLTGQDCVRGTFSHRHSGYYDTKTGEKYSPLATINPSEVEFCVYDSLLSEYAVMGFEYGNSSSDPTYLTLWEAQFGDFVNGAQIIIDQFISSAEQKWQRMSGLVLLLPHGYEGQGPEHSSARLERFLQLCAQDNIQVMNLTTPVQLFHALRRQVKRDFRKPMIVMSPKSLLRHPRVISKLKDFTDGAFHEVLPETTIDVRQAETVVFCTGKVYYDLLDHREKLEKPAQARTAIVRIEQMYPWPDHQILPILASATKLKRVVWAQEEPKNMGAWFFMQPRLRELMDKNGMTAVPVVYRGRTERASPATGSEKVHKAEQEELVSSCFGKD
ncbi:MAG: 2-oxoglutarate dehydrogenase E1 component [Bdellovibrionaceae bacterium]|nr:2-oxoglutarate dehydrogenase E1 component [Pseudobdellovibrionaceae bacterium]